MYYSVRAVAIQQYRMVKFDRHFNVEAIHILTQKRQGWKCDCEQSRRSIACRHTSMIDLFLLKDRVDKGWFYVYEFNRWEPPLNSITRAIRERAHG